MMLINSQIENKFLVTTISVIVTIILCYQNLVFYIQPNTTVLVFLLLIPFVMKVKEGQFSIRFGIICLGFISLYLLFKMQLLYFLAFFSFVLFLIEGNHGKVNILPIFIILLISPYANFIFNAFGFPIRLWLTEIAAQSLSFFITDVRSSGNNILMGDQIFSVDQECMGLKMVGYGYAITLLIIHFFENFYDRRITFSKVIAILFTASILIVLLNLLRIIFIVIVQAPTETFMHEIIGLLCFVLYLIIPIYFLSKLIISNASIKKVHMKNSQRIYRPVKLTFLIIGLSSLAYANYNREELRNKPMDLKTDLIQISGYDKSITEYNVMKYSSDKALIYIKPSCHFFAPDHSPTICWKGSGYKFVDIQPKMINENLIFTAKLQKGSDVLQTAWWFDNGSDKTISQLDWRWKSALGSEPYRLINVTSNSSDELEDKVCNLIEKNLFSIE